MSINQKILDRYDASMDDEFERQVLYRAIAISYAWAAYSAFAVGAVLAWVLPGFYSLWAFLPIFILLLPEAVSTAWLRARVPYPRVSFKTVSAGEVIYLVVCSLILVAGIAVHLSSVFGVEFSIGLAAGIPGGALAGLGVFFLLKKLRDRDRQRLDAQLGEDD